LYLLSKKKSASFLERAKDIRGVQKIGKRCSFVPNEKKNRT